MTRDRLASVWRSVVGGLVDGGALADALPSPSPLPRRKPAAPAQTSWRWRIDLSVRR